jgi:hypothetical protein
MVKERLDKPYPLKKLKLCKYCGNIKPMSWRLAMQAKAHGECECLNLDLKLKDIKNEIRIKEEIVQKMKEALEFTKNSNLSEADLINVLMDLYVFDKSTMTPLNTFEGFFKYPHKEFINIIIRLSKLGLIIVGSFDCEGTKVISVQAI